MYYLHPPPEWTAFRQTATPVGMRDANGQVMVERFPRQGMPARPLLDYPILPVTVSTSLLTQISKLHSNIISIQISSREELWWIILWRRMDPRIHWEDILMRIEIPNRTWDLERRLSNSTNNLINRSENRVHFMLSWHSTNANGFRVNEVRTLVLRRVMMAQPPLPPNSTRGLTPGLIDPARGEVPGNRIPFPGPGSNEGRLRANMRRRRGARAARTAVNPSSVNTTQTSPSNQSQVSTAQQKQSKSPTAQKKQQYATSKMVPQKRRGTSRRHRGRPSKRQAMYESSSEDDEMSIDSNRSESSEEVSKKPINICKHIYQN